MTDNVRKAVEATIAEIDKSVRFLMTRREKALKLLADWEEVVGAKPAKSPAKPTRKRASSVAVAGSAGVKSVTSKPVPAKLKPAKPAPAEAASVKTVAVRAASEPAGGKSTKTQKILAAVATVMASAPENPRTTRDILIAVDAMGVKVGTQNPLGALASILSLDPTYRTSGSAGWVRVAR